MAIALLNVKTLTIDISILQRIMPLTTGVRAICGKMKDTVEVIELEDNSYTVDATHNKFNVPVQKWSEYVFHPARWNKNS